MDNTRGEIAGGDVSNVEGGRGVVGGSAAIVGSAKELVLELKRWCRVAKAVIMVMVK